MHQPTPANASGKAPDEEPAKAPTEAARKLEEATTQKAASQLQPDPSQRTGAHPLVTLVANKQDPAVESFAQASTETLAAEAAVRAFQHSMAIERDKTGVVAQRTAEAATEATNAVKAAM